MNIKPLILLAPHISPRFIYPRDLSLAVQIELLQFVFESYTVSHSVNDLSFIQLTFLLMGPFQYFVSSAVGITEFYTSRWKTVGKTPQGRKELLGQREKQLWFCCPALWLQISSVYYPAA